MAAPREYEGPGKVYFGANALAESKRCRFRIMGNNRKVFTMKRGLAGRSRGPVEAEVTVENAVPLAGLEEEYIAKCIENENVRLVIDFAGLQIEFNGWIDSVDGDMSTDADAGLSFTVPALKPTLL